MSRPPSACTAASTKRSQLAAIGHVELERHVRVDAFDTPCPARDANSQGAQVPHDGGADPARRAGDDRGLAFEAHLAQLNQSGRMLDLKCRMRELEPFAQEHLELAPDRMAVRPGLDEHVCREGRETRT